MPRRARLVPVIAFVLSLLLHLLLLPLVRQPAEPEPDETIPPIALETPWWPRHSPTPTPVPTPIPTPRPSRPPVPIVRASAVARPQWRAPSHRRAVLVAQQSARAHGTRPEASGAPAASAGQGESATSSGRTGDGDGDGAPASAEPTPTPTPAPTRPPACAQPNVAAATLETVVPETPPLAQEQGIAGEVTVIVSLDAASRVVDARIASSPSALLDAAALGAARASRFRTEVRDCRPVAADYAFIVEFSSQ